MTAITFVAAGTPYQPSVNEQVGTITSPTSGQGLQVGDLMLLHLVASVTPVPTLSGVSWTQLEPNLQVGNPGPFHVTYYRFADSSDLPGSVTTSTLSNATNVHSGYIVAFRGVDPVVRDVTTPAGTQSATTTLATAPAITTATAGAWVVLFAAELATSGSTTNDWSSSNMTQRAESKSSRTGTNPHPGLFTAEVASPGSFSPNISLAAGTSTRSSMLTVALRPTAPPAALLPPTSLVATVNSDTQVTLTWTAAAGATGYDVERNGLLIATDVAGTTYVDSGLTPTTGYSYRVRSVETPSPGIATFDSVNSVTVHTGAGMASVDLNATGDGTAISALNTGTASASFNATAAGRVDVMSGSVVASTAVSAVGEGSSFGPADVVMWTTLTGTFVTDGGEPLAGSVVLSPSTPWRLDGLTKRIIALRPRSIRLDGNGSFSTSIPGNAGAYGPYWYWTCEILQDDIPVRRVFRFSFPVGLVTIDIADCIVG